MLQLLPVYLTSLAMITILATFARNNRKQGWSKERRNLLENVIEEVVHAATQVQVRELSQTPTAAMPVGALGSSYARDFSLQLLKLESSLGQTTPVTQNSPAFVTVGR